MVFPSSGSVSPAPPPSTGSLGSVPPLHRYYQALRLPIAPPAWLRCLRSAVPRSTPVVRSHAGRRLHIASLDPCSPVARPALFPRRPWGLPGSGQSPVRACRALRPRTSPMRQAIQRSGAASARLEHAGLLNAVLSRLHHTALTLAVYASQGGLPHRHARLASGWWLAFAGRDSSTRRVCSRRFHDVCCPSHAVPLHQSPSSRFPLARQDLTPSGLFKTEPLPSWGCDLWWHRDANNQLRAQIHSPEASGGPGGGAAQHPPA